MRVNKTWAITSFGFGILIPLLWLFIQLTESHQWLWIYAAPGPIALTLGLIAVFKHKKNPSHYGGDVFLTAGIVLGLLGTIALLEMILFFHRSDIT